MSNVYSLVDLCDDNRIYSADARIKAIVAHIDALIKRVEQLEMRDQLQTLEIERLRHAVKQT